MSIEPDKEVAANTLRRWWGRRYRIMAIMLATAIAALGYVYYYAPAFSSSGVLQLEGISPIGYKRLAPDFDNTRMLDGFLEARGIMATPEAVRLRAEAARRQGLSRFLEPMFPATK